MFLTCRRGNIPGLMALFCHRLATAAIEEWIRTHVDGCYDPIALLLMIRSIISSHSNPNTCPLPTRGGSLPNTTKHQKPTARNTSLVCTEFKPLNHAHIFFVCRSAQDVVSGLESRGIAQLRPLLDRLTMLLWPRFKAGTCRTPHTSCYLRGTL